MKSYQENQKLLKKLLAEQKKYLKDNQPILDRMKQIFESITDNVSYATTFLELWIETCQEFAKHEIEQEFKTNRDWEEQVKEHEEKTEKMRSFLHHLFYSPMYQFEKETMIQIDAIEFHIQSIKNGKNDLVFKNNYLTGNPKNRAQEVRNNYLNTKIKDNEEEKER